LCLSGGFHPTRGDQHGDFVDVALRPEAARTAWSEALPEENGIDRFELSVDPSMAKRHIERLGISDGRNARGLFGKLDPDAFAECMACRQPLLPFFGGGERDHPDFRFGFHRGLAVVALDTAQNNSHHKQQDDQIYFAAASFW